MWDSRLEFAEAHKAYKTGAEFGTGLASPYYTAEYLFLITAEVHTEA